MPRSKRTITRRRFLGGVSAGFTFFHIAPSSILGGPTGRAPSDKLGIACIGVGNRGEASVSACKGENIVGLCDVDDRLAADVYKRFPEPKKYRDFRKMLDELDRSIDAVLVSTPDHTHAVAASDAIRRGKHVYCEKPLAHSVHEIRALMRAAREQKVITQLGNQGHSFESIRTFCQWIWDGAIGKVTEIHAASDAFPNIYCQIDKLPQLAERHEVPRELDYDLWVGPAPYRPYSPLWVPFSWRGWMAFGTGCIGDWVCHVVDPSFWALDLGLPTKIRAEVKDYDPKKHAEVYPRGTRIEFQFPAKGDRGPVKLVWFDGIERPPRPAALEEGRELPGVGAVVYGQEGLIVHGSHGALDCRIVPEAKMKEYTKPAKAVPRSTDHYRDWLEAIRNGREAGSPFSYGGPLTEIGLLGAIAIRFPGVELEWDPEAMRFKTPEEANAYVAPPYRAGWKL